jgi:Zn-dependent peptidase ImmA (M78 family)
MAFFNVGSPKALESYCMKLAANFRAAKNPKRSPFAVASWIQIGKRRADSIKTKPFNKTAFRVALSNIRSLTSQRPEKFVPALTNECAKVGVAVVFEPELKHTSLSGITCWATKDKALLQLSLRYKSNDHLWFTFFHESAHLLMHNKKEIFVHELGEKNQNEKEVEADLFSRDFLIPKAEFGRLLKKKVTKDWIREFSNSIGIAPGVVVGRLQHDGHITHAEHNDLKEYYQWSHD